MKKIILDALKEKFAGISETILNRIADKKAKTINNESEATEYVESLTIQEVIDSETDRRVTDAAQTAIANYEKKHSLKGGKPVNEDAGTGSNSKQKTDAEGGNENQNQGSDLAATIAAAIKQAVEPLTAQIATLQKEKEADTFNQQLNEAIGGASDKYKQRILRDAKYLKFETPEAQAEWLEAIKAEASEDAADSKANGAVFGTPRFGKRSKGEEIPASIMAGIMAGAGKADPDAQPF